MNFASKKLTGFYANTTDISAREKALLVENRKLKKKNKRLSTAMLYLVDQIETRLPIWSGKKTEKTARPAAKLVKPVATAPPVAQKKKIVGTTWKPEKIDYTPGLSPSEQRRSEPLSMQQIFAGKKKAKEKTVEKVTPEIQNSPSRSPAPKPQIVAHPVIQPATNELSPDLAPEEVSLLAIPKKDTSKETPLPPSSETLVEREPKKTSAHEASSAYLAVSIASSPVPEAEEVEDSNDIESQVALQNEMMREAMLRRVNRLRW